MQCRMKTPRRSTAVRAVLLSCAAAGAAGAMCVPEQQQIEIYDYALGADKVKFCGPLDKAALERAAPGIPAWFESAEYAALIAPPGK